MSRRPYFINLYDIQWETSTFVWCLLGQHPNRLEGGGPQVGVRLEEEQPVDDRRPHQNVWQVGSHGEGDRESGRSVSGSSKLQRPRNCQTFIRRVVEIKFKLRPKVLGRLTSTCWTAWQREMRETLKNCLDSNRKQDYGRRKTLWGINNKARPRTNFLSALLRRLQKDWLILSTYLIPLDSSAVLPDIHSQLEYHEHLKLDSDKTYTYDIFFCYTYYQPLLVNVTISSNIYHTFSL